MCLPVASIVLKLVGVSRFFPIAIIFPLSIIISEFSIIPSSSLVQRVAFLKWMDWLEGIELSPNPTFGYVTSDTNELVDLDLDGLEDLLLSLTSFLEMLNEKLSLLKSVPVPIMLSGELIFNEIWAKDGLPFKLSKTVILNQSSTKEVFDFISIESLLILDEGFERLFVIFKS